MSIFSSVGDFLKGNDGLNAFGTVTGGLGLAASLYNGYQSNKMAQANLDLQRDSMNYQKYLNSNQQQIQAADAQAAGINPLAMNGQSLSSASASNVQAPSVDTSMIGDVLSSFMNYKAQKFLQNKQIEATKEIHNADNASKEKIAQLQAETQSDIASNNRKELARQFDQSLEHIKKIDMEKITNERDRIRLQRDLNEIDVRLKDLALANAHADLKAKCDELARTFITGIGKDSKSLGAFRAFGSQLSEIIAPLLNRKERSVSAFSDAFYNYYLKLGGFND